MILIILLVIALTVVYYYLKYYYDYWKRLGVPGPKPRFILGNVGECFLMKKSLGDIVTEIYRDYPNSSMVGIFRGGTPNLIVRDPELIKDIIVKDFNNFQDNDLDIDKNVEPLFGRNPFFLNGKEWKMVRNQLSPCFTSGKMKSVFPILNDISEHLVKFIEDQREAINGVGLEAKELCTRFTLNNVANYAFGLEGKCFQDPNCEFSEIAKKFLSPTAWTIYIIYFTTIMPGLTKILNLKFAGKEVEERIMNLVMHTLKYREDHKIVRNDFFQMMTQLKETSKEYEFGDIDVAAHAAGFFSDGYETSSVVMSFLLYHLADNPQVQSKLRQEVEKFSENGNELSFESVQNMSYLDACLNESLRIRPPIYFLLKRCTKSYTYNSKPGDGIEKKSVTFEKGTSITLPVFGLHNDPKYYKNPEKYIPERFIGTEKDGLTKYAFLPFGKGPRECLGKRFGVLQIKVGIAHIIKNYELLVNKKTQTPLKYDPLYFLLTPIGGLWIDLKKIS